MNDRLSIILIVAALILVSLLSASVLLIRHARLTDEAADFQKIAASISRTSASAESVISEAAERTAPAEADVKPILSRYAALYEKNNDMIGWLSIEGTGINYPVMFTPSDGEYYIDKDFNGNHSVSGSLFADTRCCFQPLSDNIIIFGHHMKNGAMFGALPKYRNEAYFKEHGVIRFDTVREPAEYEIIAVFYAQVYKKSESVFKFYNFINAENEKDFDHFISQIKSMSIYETGVTAVYGDKLITLVTCAYHVQNGRFVVVAKRIADPDTSSKTQGILDCPN